MRGNLEVAGWALSRAGVEAIEIAIDDMPIALADYGLRRLDIRAAFPDWSGALSLHALYRSGSRSFSADAQFSRELEHKERRRNPSGDED